LSSLQKAIIAGSTVPTELLKRMKGDLKLKSITVGYGITFFKSPYSYEM
jgi:hypothetical protein